MQVKNLTYQNQNLSINLKSFRLNWTPHRLLTGRLYIDELYAHDLRIQLPSQQKQMQHRNPKR